MKNNINRGQGLAWAAWLVFIASLFMPMETHNLAGPCAWPCTQPFTNYGWQNTSFFILSMLAFTLNLVQAILFAIFDLYTLRRVLESLFTTGVYAIIGLGQFLILLAPLWPAKIKKLVWQKLHLWVVILSTLSALAYGLSPDLRLGLDFLSGFYLWVLSFVLMAVASILIQSEINRDFSEEGGI